MPSDPQDKALNLSEIDLPTGESDVECEQIEILQQTFTATSSRLTKSEFQMLLTKIHDVIREEAGEAEALHCCKSQ